MKTLILIVALTLARSTLLSGANVSVFLQKTYQYEGGAKFTTTHFDGRYTKYGIIFETFKDFSINGKKLDNDKDGKITPNDLRLSTCEQATVIYKRLYWDRWQADSIKSQKIANILVDFTVNSGFRTDFIRYVQRKVGVKDDGILGAKTLQAINKADECSLFNSLLAWRTGYYKVITSKVPRLNNLLNGLLNRLKLICLNENYKLIKSRFVLNSPADCDCLLRLRR